MTYRKFYTYHKEEVRDSLCNYLRQRLQGAYARILIGNHGDFDRLALGVCKRLQAEGFNIDICLVFTSQKQLIKEMEMDKHTNFYKNIETVMYEIEHLHYKMRIIVSNQKMVDDSDEVVLYYTGKQLFNNNGTHRIMRYAQSKNKIVVNIKSKITDD